MKNPIATAVCLLLGVTLCNPSEAARPRRPSAAQIKRMQEQMAFMQLEMVRYQSEMAAKQQEIYKSFDDNGDGHLTGAEKARFDKHMHAIQTGAVPNPFAAAGSGGSNAGDSSKK